MATIWKPALIVSLLTVVIGLFLGETTVEAMQVRRLPAQPDISVNTGLIDDGLRWAQDHHPDNADACPQPTWMFQFGCVMATSN